jgi:hypothetical protein
MSEINIEAVFWLCLIGVWIITVLDIVINKDFDLSFLKPKEFYEKWKYTLNIFGITICIIFLNIMMLPVSIIYWGLNFLYFILTVGRKEKIIEE